MRVVEAASALARKVHLYELLALFQKTVDKYVINAASYLSNSFSMTNWVCEPLETLTLIQTEICDFS